MVKSFLRPLFLGLMAVASLHAEAQSSFMIEFDEPVAPRTAPAAPRTCESNRAIVKEPPDSLWRSLGTMSWEKPTRGGSSRSECNIWHLGGEYNMTNCHCVGEEYRGSDPDTGRAMTQYAWKGKTISVEYARAGANYRNSTCRTVTCDAKLDYAVVRCAGQTGQVDPVKITDPQLQIAIDDKVHLLTFDTLRSTEAARFSKGTVIERVVNSDGGALMQTFSSAAQSGNSGSAVFNENGEVTCLLHAIDDSSIRQSGYASRSYCTNIQSVLSDIRKRARTNSALATALKSIEHTQDAIKLADRTCQSRVPGRQISGAQGGVR